MRASAGKLFSLAAATAVATVLSMHKASACDKPPAWALGVTSTCQNVADPIFGSPERPDIDERFYSVGIMHYGPLHLYKLTAFFVKTNSDGKCHISGNYFLPGLIASDHPDAKLAASQLQALAAEVKDNPDIVLQGEPMRYGEACTPKLSDNLPTRNTPLIGSNNIFGLIWGRFMHPAGASG